MRIRALALAQRGLVLDTRGHASYVLRGLLISVMLLALLVAWDRSLRVGAPGLRLLEWLIYANFLFVSLVGIGTFTPVITEEKENLTLGLLQLAGFGGPSILIGKSVSQLLAMALMLLVQVPFALLAFTLGGVSRHQIAAAWVLLIAHLLFVYALALLGSVVASRSSLAARICALALLGYYLLPMVGLWLDPPPDPGSIFLTRPVPGVLCQACTWLTDNSALAALGAVTATGFAKPLLGTPALVTSGMATLLFIVAGISFRRSTRNDDAPGSSDRRHRARAPRSRPLDNPFFWKDFEFLSGGRRGIVLRFAAYGALLLANHLLTRNRWDGSGWLVTIVGIAVVFDLGLQCSRMFGDEIKAGTLPLLMMVPGPLRTLAYAKAAACATLALPPVLCFCLAAFVAPVGTIGMMNRGFNNGEAWYVTAQVVLGLHVAVYVSLRLRRGALELAMLSMLLAIVVLEILIAITPDETRVVLGFFLFAAAYALHPAIGALVRERAME